MRKRYAQTDPRQAFRRWVSPRAASLAAAGAHAELDVGLMVLAVTPTSVGFSPQLLAALATEGIALRVTGYPCSEEEDDGHTI